MFTIAYGSNSLSLAGPELGDTWGEDQAFTNNTLLSGAVVNNQSNRPKYKTLEYNVRNMTEAEYTSLKEILVEARGREVTLTPPVGANISAYISNADTERITVKDGCSYDLRIQFLVKP